MSLPTPVEDNKKGVRKRAQGHGGPHRERKSKLQNSINQMKENNYRTINLLNRHCCIDAAIVGHGPFHWMGYQILSIKSL